MDFERARAAVLEAHRVSAFVQLEFLHHVAVEGRAGAAEGLPLEHVKGRVQQDAVEVQADAAVIGAAKGEARVEIVVGADAGEALHGAQRVVGQHAGEVLGVVAGQDQRVGAILARGFEGSGLHHHGLGAAESFGAEDDFEFLDIAGVQMEGTRHQVVADRRDVEHVIARRDGGDAEMAGVVGGNAIRAAGELDHHVGERFAAVRVHNRAADLAGRLRLNRRQDQRETPEKEQPERFQ